MVNYLDDHFYWFIPDYEWQKFLTNIFSRSKAISKFWYYMFMLFKMVIDVFHAYHPGLAEINAPVGPQEVVGHTLNSQLLIG